MNKAVLLIAVATVPVLLTGGVYAWGVQEPAVARTHERAVALFNAMETYSGTTALDRAQEATSERGVRVVVARNTASGHEIVLRVTATSNRRSNLDWWPSPDARYQATRCYRWTDARVWGTAEEVACPATTDIDPARAPHAQPIDGRVDDQVRRALSGNLAAAGVRDELAGIREVVVREIDGSVAVAVTGTEGYASGIEVRDCVLGLRTGDTVRVWRPSDTQVAPGEASCEPASALDPALRTPPH